MFGLYGEIRWHDTLHPSVGSLSHHLSDSQDGWWSQDGRCWFGSQPITSHCGRFTLVFNGVIYNHLELRDGLRFQAWRGLSDTETMVEGLAQRGLALVLELRGMFAFAAYDRQKQQLLLGRDHLGIKPLYLTSIEDGLRFASERRALADHNGLSAQQISEVLGFGCLHSPATFFDPDSDGIHNLPAGLVVRINCDRPHDPVRYWPPQPRPDWTPLPIRSHRRARNFLRQQLEEAVLLQLHSDRSLACCLSSGLSSSILTALSCRLHPDRIASVTVGLAGLTTDEFVLTRQLARHCGSDHHELHLDSDKALAWLEEGLQCLDAPSANGLRNYLINRAVAEQGIHVGLSGLGAGSLFGGCHSHRLVSLLLQLRHLPSGLRQLLLQIMDGRLVSDLRGIPCWNRWHLLLAMRRCFSDSELEVAGADPLAWPEPPPQRITQGRGQTSWAELFGTIEPMLLRENDGMYAATGLELRMPFLDHRIAEIALRMPQRYQLHYHGLLRAACPDLIPADYPKHIQQGFSLPMHSWMLGPLRSLSCTRLEALQASGWLDPGWIARKWQYFETGQLDWRRAWCLVVLGEFAKRASSN